MILWESFEVIQSEQLFYSIFVRKMNSLGIKSYNDSKKKTGKILRLRKPMKILFDLYEIIGG